MLDALLERAREDHNVIGIVVFGSRGKSAFVTPESDWDVFVVVREHGLGGTIDGWEPDLPRLRG